MPLETCGNGFREQKTRPTKARKEPTSVRDKK